MRVFQPVLGISGMLLFASYSTQAFHTHGLARRSKAWRFLAFNFATTSEPDQSPSARKRSSTFASTTNLPSILLKRSKQSRAFRDGNPLVFTRAIKQTHGSLKLAHLAHVLVENDKPDQPNGTPHGIGFGVFNPDSLYRIRILCHRYLQPQLYTQVLAAASQEDALLLILKHHLNMAKAKRVALGLGAASDNPTLGQTDTFRLLHGEGDGLSGLAVDLVGPDVAVVMSSAAWCQVHRETITQALESILRDQTNSDTPGPSIVWKTTPSRLQQDGYTIDEPPVDETIGVEDRPVICQENGIMYQSHPFAIAGQKTSVYCDQRENRLSLAKLCKDKRVLDLCCYHGGFGLNALINGNAASATFIDSSADAIAVCEQNGQLNHCQERMTTAQSDITDWMQATYRRNEDFDVVVLDPPKLAPSEKLLEKARRKYHGINRDAIKLVSQQQGGLLLTCTCSAAMTQKDGGQYFLDMVHGAALAAGRQITLMRVSGAASCHTQSPVAWPAGAYLTAALFFVHPIELL